MTERNGKDGGKSLQSGSETPRISKLGRRLREISDQALATGTKVLSAEEIQSRVVELRGGR
jgi:hypothetical protein